MMVLSFTSATVQGIPTTMVDGAGAIGDFVPKMVQVLVPLTVGTVITGQYVLDMQANTKATIIIREITTGGVVDAIQSTTVLAQNDTLATATVASGTYWFDNTINSLDICQVVHM